MVLPLPDRDALFRLHARRLALVRDAAEARGRLAWASAGGLGDEDLARLLEASRDALEASRAAVAASMDAYLSVALELPPAGVEELAAMLPTDALVEASVLRARKVAGTDGWEAALRAGAEELAALARSDIGHAAGHALNDRLARDDARPLVAGFRRVPEAKTCGFCMAAASQVYHVGKLSPLHKRCDCDVREVAVGDDHKTLLAPYLSQYKEMRRSAGTTRKGPLSHEYVSA